jgi:protein-tyrosine phosphatase
MGSCQLFEDIASLINKMSATPERPYRILFVCMGNICRSPAAEIIFTQLCQDAGRGDDFIVDSAGTISHHQGAPPDARMAESLIEHGYRVHGTARQIQPADLGYHDLIATMDESNLADVRRLDSKGLHHEKIRPFVSFCRTHEDKRVPDPYYGGKRGFDHVTRLIEDGCRGILDSYPSR